ncbi:MAG: hypothetical protein WBW69_08255 [Candidatus Korobacteraceae bacterium]
MSRRSYGILITGLCLLTLAVIAANAATSRTAQGTWKLDVTKSSYEKMPVPKYEKLVVMTDEPAAIKWLLTGAAADGKSFVSTYDGPVDGKARPYGNSQIGNTITYTRSGGALEWTVKDKSGAVLETGTGQVSADGNTLTLKGTTQQASGKANYVSVFDRVQ